MKRTLSLFAVSLFVIGVSTLSAEVRKLKAGAGPAVWVDDLSPIAARDWSYERASHLLERAGFGGTPEEIERLARMSPQAAVNYLVDYQSIENSHLPAFEESGIYDPGMMEDVDTHYAAFTDELRKAFKTGSAYGVSPNPSGPRRYQPVVDMLYYHGFSNAAEWRRATIWWANRMLNTHRPLEEKMTLFWSGHFATEQAKVMDYRLMLAQNEMFRRNAVGNFRKLLLEVTTDPAMLIYLDNRENVKGHANENYAREVMELFTLGAGNYTEDDIKEAARALTGYTNYGPKSLFKPELHDDGEKTVLGQKGNFKAEDVIDVLLRQKVAAEFIARKIYVFFVRENPTPEMRNRLAELLRQNHYDIKPLVKTIFLSKDFYSAASYATQIKSPIQLQVSTYKKLGLTQVPGIPYFTNVMANLGQNLGNPPNVKGWDGGRAWMNPSTLLIRGNDIRHLLFPKEAGDDYPRDGVPERYANAEKRQAEQDRMAAMGTTGAKPDASAGGEGMMTAPVTQMLSKMPDYNLGLGVYHGFVKTFERVKAVAPTEADLSLTAMARGAGVTNSGDAVDYFVARFLPAPLSGKDDDAVRAFAVKMLGAGKIDYAGSGVETNLREVLHAILSMPEYQLS